jgi:hypothetical protein
MRSIAWFALLGLLVISAAGMSQTKDSAEPRPRARDLGIHPGIYDPGPLNAITDVAGVRVGQITILKDQNIRTGVTAILPVWFELIFSTWVAPFCNFSSAKEGAKRTLLPFVM